MTVRIVRRAVCGFTRTSFIAAALGLILFAAPISGEPTADPIASGDLAWEKRGDALLEDLARPDQTIEAIGHYRAALDADPGALEARWKLLRALHYAIDFTTLPDEAKEDRMREAIEVAAAGLARVESGGGPDLLRARLYFWSAIAWGTRAQRVGLITIVREGVATRMHDYALESLDLDPTIDRGGALRLLSRLHATLPRVPFVSGWVDRKKALEFAERGFENDREHPGNRLVLALTLLERAPERAPEAVSLLEQVASLEPRPEARVEDLRIRAQAREELDKRSKASS